jgi:putative hydrolase of the HAD superfamily
VLYVIETIFAGSLNRPLVDWLAGLRPGLRIAAFTNNWSFAGRILRRHQLYDTFDLVVNSAEVGCCKPEPEIYTALLERLGLLADEVVVVDDHPDNIAAAEALGFPAVQYTTLDDCISGIKKILDQGCLGVPRWKK